MFGLLNCVDSKVPMSKARAFYCLLQEGGFEKHEQIAASDKDFVGAFGTIVRMATVDIFAAANQLDNVDHVFEEGDRETLGASETMDEFSEDFLEDVFGVQARLSNDAWLKKVTHEAKWIFEPTEIRNKLTTKVGIDGKHIA